MNTAIKRHWHLVYGTVVFREKEDSPLQEAHLNGVIADVGRDIPTRGLAVAQQTLQLNLHQKWQGDPPQIIDVLIVSINYLGYMTDAEMHTPPEGTKITEIPVTVQ